MSLQIVNKNWKVGIHQKKRPEPTSLFHLLSISQLSDLTLTVWNTSSCYCGPRDLREKVSNKNLPFVGWYLGGVHNCMFDLGSLPRDCNGISELPLIQLISPYIFSCILVRLEIPWQSLSLPCAPGREGAQRTGTTCNFFLHLCLCFTKFNSNDMQQFLHQTYCNQSEQFQILMATFVSAIKTEGKFEGSKLQHNKLVLEFKTTKS